MCHETERGYRNWREWVDDALSADAEADADGERLDVDIAEPAIGQYDMDAPTLDTETVDEPQLDD
ncbi:hypothetical protein [Halorientalis litorea]|jgi:hypothetical protein|uniref:hypothetical protein n=1 Tax=Halorientalis litorea TaxID=2931977 RepID=UPI001FF444D4|nr:hypothetical protein [Halorientalis litorea]